MLLASIVPPASLGAASCGNPHDTGGVGPFDYNDTSMKAMLDKVEKFHFTASVKQAAIGSTVTEERLSGDLDYTLRAFPNHTDALYAMALHQLNLRRYAERTYQARFGPGGKWHTAECYFERALMLRPDDASVHTTRGLYLYRKKDLKGARESFTQAAAINPQSAKAQYNLGLINYEMKRYAESREHAKKAYALGYKKTDLKRLLKKVNRWDE